MAVMRRRWRVARWAGTVVALLIPGVLYLRWDHDMYVKTRWGYGIHVVEGDLALSWIGMDTARPADLPILAWGRRFSFPPFSVGRLPVWVTRVFHWPRYQAPAPGILMSLSSGSLCYDPYLDGRLRIPLWMVFILVIYAAEPPIGWLTARNLPNPPLAAKRASQAVPTREWDERGTICGESEESFASEARYRSRSRKLRLWSSISMLAPRSAQGSQTHA
jgi:hypothetical protein